MTEPGGGAQFQILFDGTGLGKIAPAGSKGLTGREIMNFCRFVAAAGVLFLAGAGSPAFSGSLPGPEQFLKSLQSRFESPRLAAPAQSEDLTSQIWAIESDLNWAVTDAEYAAQDAQWAYQLAVQYLTHGDPRNLWQSERLALSAAENSKKTSDKTRELGAKIRALTTSGPDDSAARAAEELAATAQKLFLAAVSARNSAGNLWSVAHGPYREVLGYRLQVASEALLNEAHGLDAETRATAAAAQDLLKKLRGKN
jgi:hypothetical protein